MPTDILKIFISAALTFFIGIGIAPIFTHFAFKYAWWKKTGTKGAAGALGGGETPYFDKIKGNSETETKTPRMGGVVIWASLLITVFILFILAEIVPGPIADKLSFISRNQTWLPLFTLVIGAFVGLADDILEIRSSKNGRPIGLSRLTRVFVLLFLGLVGGAWFYLKLDLTAVFIPFLGDVEIGWLIIPLFILFVLGTYSGGTIDGIDGLTGGVFASCFGAYAVIAFLNTQIDIATFCAALSGGILAFLWFNIPPARFYMTETGTMALTTTLAVIAFLTGAIVPMIIIALPLIATSATTILQYFSKKIFHKKLFLVTPIHHHFEAIGWPSYKVTMRYWVLSLIFAVLGTVVALIK